jgi:hypothetical protein
MWETRQRPVAAHFTGRLNAEGKLAGKVAVLVYSIDGDGGAALVK